MKWFFAALILLSYTSETACATLLEISKSKAVATPFGGTALPLELVATSVRKKKILVLKVDVYVAQLFVDQKAKFAKTPTGVDLEKDLTSLTSVSTLGTIALRLDFLRGLSAEKIVDTFGETLKFNGHSPDTDEGLKKVLTAIKKGGNVQKGESISIVGVNGLSADKLYLENDKGLSETIEGDAKLIEKLFSIWLGLPADSGLKKVKEDFTK